MPLSLRLDAELEARIQAYCEQTGLSKTRLISLGVRNYLETHASPTLFELASDLLPSAGGTMTRKSEMRRELYRRQVARKHARRSNPRR